jgi:SpoVK/Ycf46/Vps4 family AAA+-type ATPase
MTLYCEDCREEYTVYANNVVGLPDEDGRRRILENLTADELLDESANLQYIAKKTVNYSGSDLKNLCVFAALTRIKEDIIRSSLSNDSTGQCVDDMVRAELETVSNWADYAPESVSLTPLHAKHFEAALNEVASSISDEMGTLLELKKWEKMYGDGAKKETQQQWGFGK